MMDSSLRVIAFDIAFNAMPFLASNLSFSRQAVAALESQFEEFKLERKKERYFWTFVVTALFNILICSIATTFASVISMTFSLIMLIGVAKWLEVPRIVTHLESWLCRITMTKKPGETE